MKHGKGRPRTRPEEATGDTTYDTEDVRTYLKRRGIKVNTHLNPRNKHKLKLGRPYRLDREAYKHMRSSVERFSAWLRGGSS